MNTQEIAALIEALRKISDHLESLEYAVESLTSSIADLAESR